MQTPKEIFYENQATSIIKKLNTRKMQGYYCKNVQEAKIKMLELIGKEPKTVGYGGSMTLDENGFKDSVKNAGHVLLIRENYKTEQEVKELKAKLVNADFFLMSTNAITLDGELVNIDGFGNRVSNLICGPENVIVIAGMNKVVANLDNAFDRIRNFATPPNCVRLDCQTPCATTGKCANCYTDSICCQFVITRMSRVPDRIKVILVGETLGF